MANFFETPSVQLLERAMDVTAFRNELLSNNIANANTSLYKRRDINYAASFAASYAEALAQANAAPDGTTQDDMSGDLPMVTTHPRHMTPTPGITASPVVTTESGTSSRFDRNNVDVEYEMVQLSENAMFFQALTNSWNREATRLKMAIEGK